MPSGGAVIGALRVVLGADTAALDDGLKSASAQIREFGANAAKGIAAAGAAFAAYAVTAGYAVMHVTEGMDKISKLSRSVGVPTEQLSALKYAADLADVSTEQLGKGLVKLSKAMVEASADASSEVGRSFTAIGVSVTDATGKLRPTGDVLTDVAAKFAGYADGAAKVELATKLFGKAGADLIPFLNEGKDGITKLTDEARALGVTFDTETGKAAEEFNDNLKRVSVAAQGLWVRVAKDLLPMLVDLTNRFVEWVKEAKSAQGFVDGLSVSLKILVSSGALVVGVFRGLFTAITTVGLAMHQFLTLQWGELAKTFSAGNTDMVTIVGETVTGIKAAWGTVTPVVKQHAEESAKAQAPVIQSAKDLAAALALSKAQLQAMLSSDSGLVDKYDALNMAFLNGKITAADYTKELQKLDNEGIKQAHAEAKALLDDTLNGQGWVSAADKVAILTEAVKNGTIGFRDFNHMNEEAKQSGVQAWGDLASASSTALTTMFKDSKAAAIASTIINTAASIMKTLAYYGAGPTGLALSALAAATGAAQIAAIQSSNIGGGGSKPAAPAAGAAAAATAQAPQQSLVVQGINPGDIFKGDGVRALVDTLLDYQRQGGRVVLA